MKFVLFLVLTIFLTNCSSSLVYSPSINLPIEPPKSQNFKFYSGMSMLAETRPHRVHRETSLGLDGSFRYGVSNHVSIHVKAWSSLDNPYDESRNGILLGTLITLSDLESDWKWGVLSQGGFAFYDGEVEGGGGSISGVLWLPKVFYLKPYCALGTIIGKRNSNHNTPDRYEWGWGIINNFGLNYSISKVLVINSELSSIYQNNRYDRYSRIIFAPSLGLSLNF